MRKLMCIFVVLAVSGTAFGSSLMGPPMDRLNYEQWGVGINYSHAEENLKVRGFSFLESDKTRGTRTNRVFAEIGYGANDRLDFYFRLGGAEADIGKVSERSVVSYLDQGDWGIATEGGFRLTLCENENWTWGVLGQLGYAKLDLDKKEFFINCVDPYIWAKARVFTAQIAAGPTYEVVDGISVYGGPFVRFVRGRLDVDIDFYGERIKDSGRIREKDQFGLYGGLQAELSQSLAVQAEYQRVFDSATVFAVGLAVKL